MDYFNRFYPIVGYEGFYSINMNGQVRSEKRLVKRFSMGTHSHQPIGGYILKQINANGYKKVNLHRNGTSKCFYVHRLVAINFLPISDNPENRIINHKDGCRDNNNVLNLEWCDHMHNINHAWDIGLTKSKGEKHPKANLKSEDVLFMRELFKTGHYTKRELQHVFNVSHGCVSDIIKLRTWKHL